MKDHPHNPALDEASEVIVTKVIDGVTGQEYSPADYQERLRAERQTRRQDRFVAGPIPVPWLSRVIEMGTPSALEAGLALFYLRGLNRSDTFRVEPERFRELGIGDTARHRGLRELERLGLVRIDRSPGSAPEATLLML